MHVVRRLLIYQWKRTPACLLVCRIQNLGIVIEHWKVMVVKAPVQFPQLEVFPTIIMTLDITSNYHLHEKMI